MTNWGRWTEPAPPLWYWFKKMQERATLGIACAFPYDECGYARFVKAIGPIPRRMQSPTVGRYDHNKGYIFDRSRHRWNFRWQEKSANASECASRIELTQIGNIASAASANHNSRQMVECPHCGGIGRLPPMKRWHFGSCKAAKSFDQLTSEFAGAAHHGGEAVNENTVERIT